jgi:hypothetical protein
MLCLYGIINRLNKGYPKKPHFVNDNESWKMIHTMLGYVNLFLQNTTIINKPKEFNVNIHEFFLTIHNYLGRDWIPTCFKIIMLFSKWYFWFGYVHMGSIYHPLHWRQLTPLFEFSCYHLHFSFFWSPHETFENNVDNFHKLLK